MIIVLCWVFKKLQLLNIYIVYAKFYRSAFND